MGRRSELDKMIERFEPARREVLRKVLLGSAIYVAPAIASYSMKSLGGEVEAQLLCVNQTLPGPGPAPNTACSIPVDSPTALIAAASAVGAVGAFLLRKRRRRSGDGTHR